MADLRRRAQNRDGASAVRSAAPRSLVGVSAAVSAPMIRPTPKDEEVAAIVAAVDAMWPRTVQAEPIGRERRTSWRFSGRWWSEPTPVRRDRPYL